MNKKMMNYLNFEMFAVYSITNLKLKIFMQLFRDKNATYFKSKATNQPIMHARGLKFLANFLFMQSYV